MDNLKFGINLFGQNPNAGDEYPKMLYLAEAHTVVGNSDEEAAAIAEGFKPLTVQRGTPTVTAAPDPRDAEIAELKALLEQATKPRVGRPPKQVDAPAE